jgi:hypothetical protein
MFSRFFQKPRPVQPLEQPLDGIEFVEPVQGAGLDALRMELATRLLQHRLIENAYLPKLRYSGEEVFRNCVILVEREPISPRQREAIAAACSGIIALDVCYAHDLPRPLLSSVRSVCRPLYLPDLSLFECPLLVKKGTNQGMPSEWPLGVSFWYVAAENYEDALIHAIGSAKAIGFEFVDVYQGKVIQVDPTKWWDELVMKQWRDCSTHLPTQRQIEIAVATGGLFMGPNIGPITASNA